MYIYACCHIMFLFSIDSGYLESVTNCLPNNPEQSRPNHSANNRM